MSIVYDPSKELSKYASEAKIKKLLSSKLTVKKAALAFVQDIPFVSRKKVLDIALKVVKQYRARIAKAPRGEKGELKKKLKKDPKQLINAVQGAVVTEIASEIKQKYRGQYYIWLPSNAKEPDPEHQLKYGKKFRVGVGEMPQDRYGCRCGMRLLVEDSELEL